MYTTEEEKKDYRKISFQLLKENEKLKEENEILRGKFVLTYHKENLNEIQKATINYVNEHQPVIKVVVKDELSNKYHKEGEKHVASYKIIDREIRNLVELKVLISKEEHKKKHLLYVNEQSILLNIDKDFADFKKGFFNLVDTILEKNSIPEDPLEIGYNNSIQALFLFYQHVSNVYITQIMLKWSIKLKKDSVLLGRLYALVFSNLYEIQTRLIEKLKLEESLSETGEKFSYTLANNPILNKIVDSALILKPRDLLYMMELFYYEGLSDKVMPVIKTLWKTSFPLVWYFYGYDLTSLFEISSANIIGKEFPQLMKYCLLGLKNERPPFTKHKFDPSVLFGLENQWGKMNEENKIKVKKMLSEILEMDPDEKRISEYVSSLNKN